jgi:hypothetical protein
MTSRDHIARTLRAHTGVSLAVARRLVAGAFAEVAAARSRGARQGAAVRRVRMVQGELDNRPLSEDEVAAEFAGIRSRLAGLAGGGQ